MMVMDKLSRVQQHRLLAPALLGAVLLLSGCGGADSPTGPSGPSGLVVGSGVRVTQERAVGSFSEVVFGVVGRLIIEQTGRDSLAITADDNLLPLLRSDVIGGRLVLDVRDDVGGIAAIGEVTFRLTVRDLAEIDASGAVPVFVEVIAIDAAALTVRLGGPSSTTVAGRVDQQVLSIGGPASYDATALQSRQTAVDANGPSRTFVRVSDRLSGTVAPSAVVEYCGNPTVDVTGNGALRPSAGGC